MVQYTFYPPDLNLNNYISTYAYSSLANGEKHNLHAPPNGFCGFVINIDKDDQGKIVAIDYQNKPFAQQLNYVVGQTTQLSTGYIQGKIAYLIVFFKPLGLHHFFGTNMQTLTNKTVDLHYFLGHERANVLIDNLKNYQHVEEQIKYLNDFFNQIKTTHNIAYTQKAIDLIDEANGNISVKEIEEKLSINRRTLERCFKMQVGISPKVYAQIFRFKCTMHFLQANPSATWAQITYKNGFFDQSHLIKYFKEYLHVSPTDLVTLDNDFINYLLR